MTEEEENTMKLIIARHLIPCTGGRAQVAETETGILIESGLIRRVDRRKPLRKSEGAERLRLSTPGTAMCCRG